MRRTRHITLGLLAAMAVAFTSGCSRQAERRDCVDLQGRLANDQNCEAAEQQRRTGYGGTSYRYLYGGSSGGHLGDVVVNGSPSSSGGGGFLGGIMRGGFGGHGDSGGE
jgi:hypothetical protein